MEENRVDYESYINGYSEISKQIEELNVEKRIEVLEKEIEELEKDNERIGEEYFDESEVNLSTRLFEIGSQENMENITQKDNEIRQLREEHGDDFENRKSQIESLQKYKNNIRENAEKEMQEKRKLIENSYETREDNLQIKINDLNENIYQIEESKAKEDIALVEKYTQERKKIRRELIELKNEKNETIEKFDKEYEDFLNELNKIDGIEEVQESEKSVNSIDLEEIEDENTTPIVEEENIETIEEEQNDTLTEEDKKNIQKAEKAIAKYEAILNDENSTEKEKKNAKTQITKNENKIKKIKGEPVEPKKRVTKKSKQKKEEVKNIEPEIEEPEQTKPEVEEHEEEPERKEPVIEEQKEEEPKIKDLEEEDFLNNDDGTKGEDTEEKKSNQIKGRKHDQISEIDTTQIIQWLKTRIENNETTYSSKIEYKIIGKTTRYSSRKDYEDYKMLQKLEEMGLFMADSRGGYSLNEYNVKEISGKLQFKKIKEFLEKNKENEQLEDEFEEIMDKADMLFVQEVKDWTAKVFRQGQKVDTDLLQKVFKLNDEEAIKIIQQLKDEKYITDYGIINDQSKESEEPNEYEEIDNSSEEIQSEEEPPKLESQEEPKQEEPELEEPEQEETSFPQRANSSNKPLAIKISGKEGIIGYDGHKYTISLDVIREGLRLNSLHMNGDTLDKDRLEMAGITYHTAELSEKIQAISDQTPVDFVVILGINNSQMTKNEKSHLIESYLSNVFKTQYDAKSDESSRNQYDIESLEKEWQDISVTYRIDEISKPLPFFKALKAAISKHPEEYDLTGQEKEELVEIANKANRYGLGKTIGQYKERKGLKEAFLGLFKGHQKLLPAPEKMHSIDMTTKKEQVTENIDGKTETREFKTLKDKDALKTEHAAAEAYNEALNKYTIVETKSKDGIGTSTYMSREEYDNLSQEEKEQSIVKSTEVIKPTKREEFLNVLNVKKEEINSNDEYSDDEKQRIASELQDLSGYDERED